MQIIYTSAWARDKVKTEEHYLEWLGSLKNNDRVLMQKFCPGKDSAFDLPFERWEFEEVRVWNNVLVSRGNDRPFERETGALTYWGGDEWGEVFPARIVPKYYDMGTKELGDKIWGHKPIYEPLWQGASKLFFLVESGPNIYKEKNVIRKHFPRNYESDCQEGYLQICFSQYDRYDWDNWVKENQFTQTKFLYSTYCQF